MSFRKNFIPDHVSVANKFNEPQMLSDVIPHLMRNIDPRIKSEDDVLSQRNIYMSHMLINTSLLNQVSTEAKQSDRLRKNYNFHESGDDLCHRLLNAIEPGSFVPVHKHDDSKKSETIICIKGKLGAIIFDAQGELVEKAILAPDSDCIGIDIPFGTYHSVLALEPGTVFFESKAGPYVPPTEDEILDDERFTVEYFEKLLREPHA